LAKPARLTLFAHRQSAQLKKIAEGAGLQFHRLVTNNVEAFSSGRASPAAGGRLPLGDPQGQRPRERHKQLLLGPPESIAAIRALVVAVRRPQPKSSAIMMQNTGLVSIVASSFFA